MNVNAFLFNKFIKKIRARWFYQNKNWLSIICGETGSGKSYSALALAKLIGNKVWVVFTPLEFLQLLTSGKLSKGDVIVFDEAGVGMSSREWYSLQNKLLGSVLQTFRNMNVSVIFTTPNLSFIDVQARKLFHNYFETDFIDYNKQNAFIKVYDIEINSRLDKIYYKNPKFWTEDSRLITMTHLALAKPDKALVDYYEEKKLNYTKNLNNKALNDLLNPKGDKEKKEVNLEELKEKVLKNPDDYLKEYKKRKFVDVDLLRNNFDLTISQAKLLKGDIEKNLL